ncbi:uncharacterized protein LOC114333564 [Diabrotica virgifera virgifera]|uniref:Uncharacterized protein LOC114333564 n=1 Tax=Diabrotica virgifera virgifera TaxID=50390 RepID=A0A6P7FSI1_DIAVI|nr:uncharacterized protein LOC114333564 [Diabrotica virgifera virgifera]
MKVLICGIICLFAFCGANPVNPSVHDVVSRALERIDYNNIIPKELITRLRFLTEADILGGSEITVFLNQYADTIFNNLQNFIRQHNWQNVDIPDTHLKISGGSVDLTRGNLNDLDTISRGGDVILTYEGDNKKLVIELPITFGDLRFHYHHHTKVLFISMSGEVDGTVKHIQVSAIASFDFNSNTVFLDHYDMKHSGDVTVHFSGNPVVDWLANAISAVVTTFMGQVIINVMAKFIRDNLRAVIENLNEAIAQIINH